MTTPKHHHRVGVGLVEDQHHAQSLLLPRCWVEVLLEGGFADGAGVRGKRPIHVRIELGVPFEILGRLRGRALGSGGPEAVELLVGLVHLLQGCAWERLIDCSPWKLWPTTRHKSSRNTVRSRHTVAI